MPIIGFNFDRISIEKTNKISEKLSIKNDLSITNLEKEKLNLSPKESVLKFDFKYSVDYEPKVGKIILTGNLLYMEEEKRATEILTGWKKDKRIPTDIGPQVLNTILAKCNIKALNLTQDVNLPPHIKLPILKTK